MPEEGQINNKVRARIFRGMTGQKHWIQNHFQLVREALDTVYIKRNKIEQRKQIALEAYKEGFISIGKLSEVTGLDIVSLRLYLKEQGIPLKTQDREEVAQDVVNA